jgi:hypothetical protein
MPIRHGGLKHVSESSVDYHATGVCVTAKVLSLIGIAVSSFMLLIGVSQHDSAAVVLVPFSILTSGCIIALAIVEGLSRRKDN